VGLCWKKESIYSFQYPIFFNENYRNFVTLTPGLQLLRGFQVSDELGMSFSGNSRKKTHTDIVNYTETIVDNIPKLIK